MKFPVGSDDTIVADLLAIDPGLQRRLEDQGGVSLIARGLAVHGNVRATTHLVVDGRVDGQINAPEHSVYVATHGEVHADIFAQDITIRGVVNGNVTATASLKVHADARVGGRLSAPNLVIDDGARVTAQVDPYRAETTAAVMRHRLKQPVAEVPRRTETGQAPG